MADSSRLQEYLKGIPKTEELRNRLSENQREAKLIRQLLKIVEQSRRVKEAAAK